MDNVEVLGFEGEINSLNEFLDFINYIKSKNPNSIIQFIDASGIGGLNHINHVIAHSYLAFERNENLANDLSVEILLRASAQRQISKAFKILGLKEGKLDICAIFINCSKDVINECSSIFIRNDDVLNGDVLKLKKIYDIHDDELEVMDIEDILIDKSTKLIVDY